MCAISNVEHFRLNFAFREIAAACSSYDAFESYVSGHPSPCSGSATAFISSWGLSARSSMPCAPARSRRVAPFVLRGDGLLHR
jgi:hypothetical protein